MSTPEEKIVRQPAASRTWIYATVAIVVVIVIVLAAGVQAGWFKTKPAPAVVPPPTTGCTVTYSSTTLLGAGSSFVNPLMVTWAADYAHSQVIYSPVGSGTGITDLTQKTIDFGASDAPLSPAQQAALPGKVVTIPETAGGVAIIYNVPGLGTTLQLTGAVLANIYLGSVTSWNDTAIQAINPGVTLPTQNIVVVHRIDGSGTSFAFTDFLSKSSSQWNTQVGKATSVSWPVGVGEKGSSAVASYVGSNQYTVGYVDLEYALTNGISFAKVQNPAGAYILPTLNDTASAVKNGATALPKGDDMPGWYNVSLINEPGPTDYPVTTFSYLMVYESLDGVYGSGFDLNKAENLVNFLNWTLTYGQSYSGQLYYVPLASNVVAGAQLSLALITFGGSAVPLCTQR